MDVSDSSVLSDGSFLDSVLPSVMDLYEDSQLWYPSSEILNENWTHTYVEPSDVNRFGSLSAGTNHGFGQDCIRRNVIPREPRVNRINTSRSSFFYALLRLSNHFLSTIRPTFPPMGGTASTVLIAWKKLIPCLMDWKKKLIERTATYSTHSQNLNSLATIFSIQPDPV